ncbi:exodeoxyribonuclease VII small subunit [Kroppenstedtia eburnea]|uniref:Exodeoxyribonuclease 7 small subunit n=1 Tax=Kroppenstedtia eburnea TaxID=714067 RepID=A0A1N7ILP0_9BACL|nr:exodeoxyribonuclease VII small subunit [Kroppenstedtia eburnea]EGK14338.1 exodeoxyribonuclease VII small subunit [Desmospora sp. 8437]QKI81949.1 exodeoxyribonuclease VII small subunit [Kroppenstedtia eburnea]SIS37990.1 Exodeoxyribonuclease VII small subunit [Kroppenstedtia eburnea]
MEKADKQKEAGLPENLSFEEAMDRLEEVVEHLESGEVPLEESIRLFEEGMKLSRYCGEKLEKMEQHVEMLVRENGEWVKKPFQSEEEME